MHKIHD